MNKPMSADEIFNEMMKSNPKFKDFVEQNKGKSVEEIAKAYGLNPALLSLLKR